MVPFHVRLRDGRGHRAPRAYCQVAEDRRERLLLEKGAEINAHGAKIGTALQRASRYGHTAVVKFLLKQEADVNAHSEFTDTALQNASQCGHNAVVRLLLDKGADIDAHGGSVGTALQIASQCDHEES